MIMADTNTGVGLIEKHLLFEMMEKRISSEITSTKFNETWIKAKLKRLSVEKKRVWEKV